MNDLIKYYGLTLVFYIVEIGVFAIVYKGWEYDVFWLSLAIRLFLVSIFSVVVRKLIFPDTKGFHVKFGALVVLNPMFSATLLKLLSLFLPLVDVLILKFFADAASSLLVFIALKKST
jgi:hypothetical protein